MLTTGRLRTVRLGVGERAHLALPGTLARPRSRADVASRGDLTGIDLFAGLGGFSFGAQQAGLRVTFAINHWLEAVQAHEANMPEVVHVCEDVRKFDWRRAPKHDVMLASPSCKGFTRARGKERMEFDAYRATSWGVVEALEVLEPRAVIVENVPEMRDWKLFPAWRAALEGLGYRLTENVLDAADLGVPMHRTRLSVVGTRDRAPPTIANLKKPHTPVSSVLRWDEGAWDYIDPPRRRRRPLAPRWRQIIEEGGRRFGPRFLVPYYGSTATARSIERPLGSISTKGRFGLVDLDRGAYRMLETAEIRDAMGFPSDVWLPPGKVSSLLLLGNAVAPPQARHVVSQVLAAVA